MENNKLRPVLLLLIGFCCFLLTAPVFAVDTIDTEFGNSGFAVKDFGIGDDEAFALAVQSDGKILVAGYSSNGAVMNLSVARYLPNGILDISFNYDGLFTLSMGSGDTVARSIVVQRDGRILVAGSSFDMEPRLVVVALTPDGYLDSAFGENGQIVIPVRDEAVVTTDLKVAADGSIIVGATVEDADSSRFPLIVKMTSSGELDNEFGDDGLVRYRQDYNIEMYDFTLLEDGKILIAGSIERDEKMRAGLLRRNANGTPDNTFGNEGELLLEIGGSGSVIYDLWPEPEGSILVAGSIKNGETDQAFAARLLTEGVLDPLFVGTGLFRSELEYENAAYGITVQQDGTVVLAGFGTSAQGKDVIVWSLSETDQTQNVGEDELLLDGGQQIVLRSLSVPATDVQTTRIITDIAEADDISYAISALSSGAILTAGSSSNGDNKDFVLVRYTSENMAETPAAATAVRGVTTAGFRVLTTPAGDITRIGAVSGGTIYDTNTLSCETACEADSCTDTELQECRDSRTVNIRGVVFSVYRNPVYRVKDDAAQEPTSTAVTDDNSFIYDTVRSGQTEDGSGIGAYGSDIQEITPDVTYYVRAYGVLADDTVIYGNEISFKTDDACFIATAAYGSVLNSHVALLRQFRDTYLMPNSFGRKLVGVYYHFSPALATVVEGNIFFRGLVRIILWPFVVIAFFMLKISPAIKLAGSIVTLLVACFFLMPKVESWKQVK